jgi:hypothetical protein
VVDIQCNIRVVRRVVKQLPVEMLQQCSGASNCTHMHMHIVMKEQYIRCQHSMPLVLNGSLFEDF